MPIGYERRVITYQVVRHTAKKSGKCADCKKPARRQVTLENTINPYNKDPETGQPRTYAQIVAKLVAEGKAWQAESIVCTACTDIRRQAQREREARDRNA